MSAATSSMDLLRFLCVGRLVSGSDGKWAANKHLLLCSLSSGAKEVEDQVKTYKQHVKAIMNKGANKLVPGRRIRLTSDDSEYDLHVLADQIDDDPKKIVIFFAVTGREFQKNHPIANLLRDFRSGFYEAVPSSTATSCSSNGGLNKACSALLGRLFQQYGSSLLSDVTLRVDEIKNVMRNNVTKALDNVEQLEEMETKSEAFEEQAKLFEKGSSKVKSLMRCRYYKIQLLLCLLVSAIVAYIIYAIYQKTSE